LGIDWVASSIGNHLWQRTGNAAYSATSSPANPGKPCRKAAGRCPY